jgi:hypothetical protein
MTTSIPQLSPNARHAANSAVANASSSMPSAEPPAGMRAAAHTGCGCGGGAGAADAQSAGAPPAVMFSSADAAPMLQVAAGGVAAAIGAWNSNKRITALWTINQDRNSWMHIDGTGWKRLSNASESGVVAMTRLAANARERGSTVVYRDEADGLVHEIYVW